MKLVWSIHFKENECSIGDAGCAYDCRQSSIYLQNLACLIRTARFTQKNEVESLFRQP